MVFQVLEPRAPSSGNGTTVYGGTGTPGCWWTVSVYPGWCRVVYSPGRVGVPYPGQYSRLRYDVNVLRRTGGAL